MMKFHGFTSRVKPLHSEERGFTLVEILVVIAVLAILAAVVVPNFTGLVGSGITSANAADKISTQTIVDAYMANNRLSDISAVVGFASITPANYNTGPYAAFFRTAPKCSYTVVAAGGVTQTACP